jgi:hypothetical protein
MYKTKLIFIQIAASMIAACATTEKAKITQTIITGAAIGAIYGLTRKEMKEENAMMFSYQGAAIGALAGLYYHDPDKKVDELQSQVEIYKKLQLEQAKDEAMMREKSLGSMQLHEVDQLKRKGWREKKIDGYFQVAPNFIYHSQGIITPDDKYLLGEPEK